MMGKNKGVLMFDVREPKIHGYLILGDTHWQITGERISDIRTNLHLRKMDEEEQEDLFDEPTPEGA
jgi:hypothetical protein